MKPNDADHEHDAQAVRALAYLRKRSQHRIWWKSAQLALKRGRSGEKIRLPVDRLGSTKRS